MITEDEAETILVKEGFTNIYIWQDGPNTYYAPHKHKTDSAHIILAGEITLITKNQAQALLAGERFDVPAGVEHAAQIGRVGCKYMVGEK
jgi:mannose-6-phosphate isomerase-like protein (cupin superfamily)